MHRFRSKHGATSLDWRTGSGLSLRSYEIAYDRPEAPCGSAHHAELVIAIDGRTLTLLGPKREATVLRAGEALLVPRGTPHLWSAEGGSALAVLDLDLPAAGPSVSAPVAGPTVARLAHAIDRVMRGRALDTIRDPLSDLLYVIGDLRAPEPVHDTRAMLRVLRDLDARYTEPLSLDDLAATHRLERHYLVRSFTRNFGVPPMTYVRSLRERRFLWSILGSVARPRALGSVASEAGVGDYPTFCRAFRRRWGQTPSSIARPDGRSRSASRMRSR